jgi:Pvc16 N-terminal domain
MSNSLAIAAVTATLRNLLQGAIQPVSPGAQVTVRPLDRARENMTVDSVNLFLYNTGSDAAWRNADMPGINPGELADPPLALTLSYLVTSFSQSDDDTISHRLLGGAMNALNQALVLDPAAIQAALPGNDLYLQAERVKVTLDPLDVEEISKLWTAFQTSYRISAAYRVSAVLIQDAPGAAPLPVLTRGAEDQGPLVQPLTVQGTLQSVIPPKGQLSAQLGDTIVLTGDGLAGTSVSVRLINQRRAVAEAQPAANVTNSSVRVTLPSDPATFPAGTWTAQAVISRAGQDDWITNAVPFAVAPRLPGMPLTVSLDPAGTVTIALNCEPDVGADQDCALLIGSEVIVLPGPRTASLSAVTFTVPGLTTDKTYPVRLRVDGVDSPLVDASQSPPVYDTSQAVTIE